MATELVKIPKENMYKPLIPRFDRANPGVAIYKYVTSNDIKDRYFNRVMILSILKDYGVGPNNIKIHKVTYLENNKTLEFGVDDAALALLAPEA